VELVRIMKRYISAGQGVGIIKGPPYFEILNAYVSERKKSSCTHKANPSVFEDYIRPQRRRFSWIMISFTAAITNLICVVSVAQVKCV